MVTGDFTEITYNHPSLGNGAFFPKSGEDGTLDLGGYRSSDDANMIDGGGNMIDQMNRTRWSFEGPIAGDMNTREDLEKLTALAGSPLHADWTFTHISGAVYSGKGKPVGDLAMNGNNGQISLKVAGGGVCRKIVG